MYAADRLRAHLFRRQVTVKQLFIRAQDHVINALVLAALVAFVVIATYRVHLPGLYYDEVLFVNAARGGPQDSFVFARFGSLPIMVMPYIGALKSWLYYPIFATFGVSVWTIRCPMILIAAATLLLYYLFLRKMLGRICACGVVWLMALNPAFIFFSRLDLGPFVLMQFFRATMLMLWLGYLEKPSLLNLACLGACAILGFFDKFNFIWLILAFAAGVIFIYPEEIRRIWESLSRRLQFACVLFSIALSTAAAVLVFPLLRLPAAGSGNWLDKISYTWHGILSTLSGTALADIIFGSNEGVFTFEPWGTLLPAMVAGAGCLMLRNKDADFRATRKAGWFCMTAMILVFIQIVITRQATAPWHHVMIFPLSLLALAFFVRAITRYLGNDNRAVRTARVFTAASVVAFLVLGFAEADNTFSYLKRFKTTANYNPRWSPAIYKLVKFISKNGRNVDKVVCIDWGIGNQLEALSSIAIDQKLEDYWPFFKNLPESTNANSTNDALHLFNPRRNLAIDFAESKETFPETRRHFLTLMHSQHFESRLLTTIKAADQNEIYEVYEVTEHFDQ